MAPPLQENCPDGSTVQKKGCCECCVDATTQDCVPQKPDCTLVLCPPAIDPFECEIGSVYKKKDCCKCCVNTQTNDCTPVPDCSLIDCRPLANPPRCPPNTEVKKKGCCDCCFSEETGDCVEELPAACDGIKCAELPIGKQCPTDTIWKGRTDPETGCTSCPCCVKTSCNSEEEDCDKCYDPIYICPLPLCLEPPETCPKGSEKKLFVHPVTGCKFCICCVGADGYCVQETDESEPAGALQPSRGKGKGKGRGRTWK
eukprot:TRINITY_DN2374_c0_g1_i2.p1 TRINITY_DN2374_c0_g1~~TRINITY_DN2374_c0_g1_i2.p1  ORF type:complete len:257 (-),score=28.94 TRINITY_DN2374_c0_g1_i2:93-863(-)